MEVKFKRIKSTFDISIGQFQEFDKLENPTEQDIVSIFYKIDKSVIPTIPFKQIAELANELKTILDKEHKLILKYKGLGFEPDLDNMSTGAFADAVTYAEKLDTIHLFTAVMYRPIKKDIYWWMRSKQYNLKEYTGTKGIEDTAKDLPLALFLGAQAFFLTLRNDFLRSIRDRFQAESKQQKANLNKNDLTKIGGGVSDFMQLLEETILKSMQSQKSLYQK